jgi:hypothetical protein
MVNITTRTSHYESFTMSGTGYMLNARPAPLGLALSWAATALRLAYGVPPQQISSLPKQNKMNGVGPNCELAQVKLLGQLENYGATR